MKIDVNAFKRELENYYYYQINLKGTLELIEFNEYLLTNVRGIDPSKEPNDNHTIWVESDSFKRISDELDKLYKRRDLRIMQIEYIESILDKLSDETKKACIDIYVKGETYAKISAERFLSKKGLFYRIEKELDEKLQL